MISRGLQGRAGSAAPGPAAGGGVWSGSPEERLREVVELMRTTSRSHDDPQRAVLEYANRVRRWTNADRVVSISRRGLSPPRVRITRSSTWREAIDPWREGHRLPVLDRGFFSEVMRAGEPRVILDACFSEDDPGRELLEGMRSALVLPTWDDGEALNMVVQLSAQPRAFDPDRLPEQLWISNLFGRVTKNIVLGREVKEAYAALDQELKVVADIQRSLLPEKLPTIPGLDVSAWCTMSRRAGGDYYDFFHVCPKRVGVLVADVAGHGTPAAVMMAIVHAIAHLAPGICQAPQEVLSFINRQLCERYTRGTVAFVTAFYGVYHTDTRELEFASAGHPMPLWRHADASVHELDGGGVGLPLGILDHGPYARRSVTLEPGQSLLLYTDGISEAFSPAKEMFGEKRLAQAFSRTAGDARSRRERVLGELSAFCGDAPQGDDRTLVILDASPAPT